MIPIECPKCGRGGNVPPDRLNARLVCKGCSTVFHMDNTGRMALGEPGSSDPKPGKSRQNQAKVEDFDLAQTFRDIPKPVRYGVPAVLLAVFGYLYLAPGEGAPGYVSQATAVMRAVASNDRSRVISHASSDSAEATGKWFDLVHGELEKGKIGSDVNVSPGLMSGDPEKGSDILLMVVVSNNGTKEPPVTINLPMKREGSSWKVDGGKSLAEAEAMAKKSR